MSHAGEHRDDSRGHPRPTLGSLSTAVNSAGDFDGNLAAENITVRIRWFGVCVGIVLVNFSGRAVNPLALNAILSLGAAYALIDGYYSYRRGRVFLRDLPLFVSLMEAIFIGFLCHFDTGLGSPFRFYYFLSLLVCAIRYSPAVTYITCVLHAVSYGTLMWSETRMQIDWTNLVFMLVLMGWLTWAGTALANIVKAGTKRLSELNAELKENQLLLEDRIAERTRELQESQALLVQQEKQAAFGLLAAGIAHEVGNPLAAISSLVQLLNRRHADDYTRERLQMVDDQLARIQRTLRELVDFSRPTSHEKSLCDIHELIDAALSIAKYYKRKKGRAIVTHFDKELPRLRTARDPMVQVFLNLILNALDATREGGTVEISTKREDGWIEVVIQDDGHGIPTQDRDAIFEPYYTTKDSGTGLGLFVCRHLVEELGDGRIDLTDSDPNGTTFTVSIQCPALLLTEAPAIKAVGSP